MGTGLALLVLVVGATSGNDTAVASSDASLRAAVWQALVVLSERGLAVQSASPEEGRIVTVFTPLAPEALAKTTVLTE